MRIDLVAAALPPRMDGIGDYTARLARVLSRTNQVRILTTTDAAVDPIPGVTVEPCFSLRRPSGVRHLATHLGQDRPDWVVLQYNPFSFGRRGLNTHLPRVMRAIKRRSPGTGFALMVHEPFVDAENWKLVVMTTWQRWQLWTLGRTADVVFLSIDPWAQRFRRWFPGKPVLHLPVSSNIPVEPTSRAAARARLGIDDRTLVMGVFGTAHPSRLWGWVRGAAEAVRRMGQDVHVLYLGPHTAAVREALGPVSARLDGPLPVEEISRRFAAMDIYLAPYSDGVSTRRTSLMTGLQHGVATVGTSGIHTDRMLRKEDGRAFLLADSHSEEAFHRHVRCLAGDAERRASLGEEGQCLFEREFCWERIAARMLRSMERSGTRKAEKIPA
jgi:glycosyltransferase involved in cell wall biosynthesis